MSSEWRKQCQDIKIVEDFKHNLRTNPHRGFPKQHLLAWCNFVGPNGQTRLRQTSIPLDKCIGWNSDGFAGSNPRFIAESDGNGPTKGQCWNCVYQYWVREGQPNLGCWCKSAPPPKLVYEEESGDMGVQKFFNLDEVMRFSDGNLLCHGFSAMPYLEDPSDEQLLRISREGISGYSPPRYRPPDSQNSQNPPSPLNPPAAPPPRYGEAPPRYEPRAPSN
ncbi:hypothetical protein RU639_010301 [Aspergillus parasiticus]